MTPPANQPHLQAAPQLFFELERTVGVVTAAGYSAGRGSNRLSTLPGAVSLLQEIGPDRFCVLWLLMMLAEESDGRLYVEGGNDVVREYIGWGRSKVSKVLIELESDGLISRTQDRINNGSGRPVFAAARIWITPSVVQPTLRLVRSSTPDATPAKAPATADRFTVNGKEVNEPPRSRPTADSISVDGESTHATTVDSRSVDGGEPAGQTAGLISVSGGFTHHHEYEDAQVHDITPPSHADVDVEADLERSAYGRVVGDSTFQPIGATLAFSPIARQALARRSALPSSDEGLTSVASPIAQEPSLPIRSDADVLDVLAAWNVRDRDKLLAEHHRSDVLRAIETVHARGARVSTPGAYFRKLLEAFRTERAGTGSVPPPPSNPSSSEQSASFADVTPTPASFPPPADAERNTPTPPPASGTPSVSDITGRWLALPATTRSALDEQINAELAADPIAGRRPTGRLAQGFINTRRAELLAELSE